MLTVERIRALFAPNTPKDLDRPLTDFRSVFSIWYRVVHGLGRPAGRVGLGRVVSRFCTFQWVGFGWVEYDKSRPTIFLMITQHTILRDRAS